jgi:hypothetical protein
LKKDSHWSWLPEHDQSFNNVKAVLTKKPVLQYYDVNKPIVLSVDSSKDGVAAVLIQNNLPCAYASKALTDAQKNYSQIEKEAYAIVFATERFHQYIYGKSDVSVESDHKPLQYIFNKPLHKCPARLQRMIIRIQPYNLKVQYKPGRELYIADALSRNYLDEVEDHIFDSDIEYHISTIIQLPMTDQKYKLFQKETLLDDDLQTMIGYVANGWPPTSSVKESLRFYYSLKDGIFVHDGLLFKDNCVIVPNSLRRDMLEKVHYNHLGVNKCKARARECIFWPGMSKQIEDMVTNCNTCLQFQVSNRKEPLMPKEIPCAPFEVVGTDLFHFQNSNFLIVIDYFSKFVEFFKLSDLSSETTVIGLKSCFARYGIPKLLYSDGGPQFSSRYFKDFSKNWGFENRMSSPHYPQSNGMVERCIQTVKRMLHKSRVDNKDPYLALLEYRNTPISEQIPSPAEILFKRKLNGLLPCFSNKVQMPNDEVQRKLKDRQEKQKIYFDRTARKRKNFHDGENVFILDKSHKLVHAQVRGNEVSPRSFNVMLENGNVVRRNSRHVYKGSPNYRFTVRQENNDFDINNGNEGQDIGMEGIQNRNGVDERVEERNVVMRNRNNACTRSGRVVRRPKYLNEYV